MLTSLYYSHHTLLHFFHSGLRFFNCNSLSGSVKSSSETLDITLTNTKTIFVIYTPEISLFVYVSLQRTPTYQHLTVCVYYFYSFVLASMCNWIKYIYHPQQHWMVLFSPLMYVNNVRVALKAHQMPCAITIKAKFKFLMRRKQTVTASQH